LQEIAANVAAISRVFAELHGLTAPGPGVIATPAKWGGSTLKVGGVACAVQGTGTPPANVTACSKGGCSSELFLNGIAEARAVREQGKARAPAAAPRGVCAL